MAALETEIQRLRKEVEEKNQRLKVVIDTLHTIASTMRTWEHAEQPASASRTGP
jgi:hypothetical protein